MWLYKPERRACMYSLVFDRIRRLCMRVAHILILLFFSFVSAANAQNPVTGGARGKVCGPQANGEDCHLEDKGLSEALITFINQESSNAFSTRTGNNGDYSCPFLM